jgi:predicted nuclease of predicted toxin-antitoxin system
MRFLVDESTGKRFSELLKEAGHDVLFVGDSMSGASDETVLDEANKQGRILVTDDKDFGELVFRLLKPTSGVVLLRLAATDPERRLGFLLGAIESYDLESHFTTIADSGTKIRKA